MTESADTTIDLATPPGVDGVMPGGQWARLLTGLHPGYPALTVGELVEIDGLLQVPLLRDACAAVMARRTASRQADLYPGRSASDPGLDFAAVTAPSEPSAERRRIAVQRWAGECGRQPFELDLGPLWRVRVLSMGPRHHAMLIQAHQVAADRHLVQGVLGDIGRGYSTVTGPAPPPEPGPVPWPAGLEPAVAESAGPGTPAADALMRRLAALPGIEMPFDRARPATLSFSGAPIPLDPGCLGAERAAALARAHRTTAEIVLCAAFAVLVHRYTNVGHVIIGMPFSDPTGTPEGTAGLPGNVLVLCFDLHDDPTFDEVVTRARQAFRDALAHRGISFGLLVRKLWPDRDLSRRPVCQIGFELRSAPRVPLAGCRVSPLSFDEGSALFDLTLVVTSGVADDAPAATLVYDTDLFSAATATSIGNNLCTLLSGLLDRPGERISGQPVLTADETYELTAGWNDTRVEFSGDRLVHQLIDDQAARRPGAIALTEGNRLVTYRELNRQANQIAHYLRRSGVGPQLPVGVRLGRSVAMVAAVLGVLKAGGAAILLDPTQPTKRLSFMLADSGARALVTTADLLPTLPADYSGQVCCLDRDANLLAGEPDTEPAVAVYPENLCQIAYTSGSTGEPRAVAFRHGAVLRVSQGTQRSYALTEDDHGSWISAPGFGISFVNELWPFLTIGATVHLVGDTTLNSPFALRDWLIAEGVTVTLLTKVLAEQVCTVDWPASAGLRVLMASGERVGWLPSALPFEVVTIYGSTEATNATSCLNVADGVRITPKSVPPEERHRYGSSSPVGRPVPNARTYILDDRLQVVPIGVPGQLFVGGDLIQAGYLNRPELTAAKWLPDPFAPQPGARMVATGDIARATADGIIVVLGRADDQVSLNGYRIELGEIAGLLIEHPAVRQAVAMIREDTPGERRLVAYVVPEQMHRPGGAELRELLREQLPGYMVPARFVILDTLPLLPNGKVNRSALPAPGSAAGQPGRYLAPRTPTEDQLAGLWQRVLRHDRVGVQDNYFELGGDSLMGMELMAAIGVELGVDLPLRTLFDAPTVELLARLVEQQAGDGTAGAGVAKGGQ